MLTNVTAKGDNLAHTESHSGRGGNASNDQNSLRLLTQRFRDALAKGVEGIVEAGKVLIEAKNKLPHGNFTDWVDRELRFGAPAKTGSREANIRKGQMLRMLAEHEVISNASHWHALPPSIRTLYELTQIRPKQRLLKLIEDGRVHAGTTREEFHWISGKIKAIVETQAQEVEARDRHTGGRLPPIRGSRLRAGPYSQPKAGETESDRSNV